MAYFSVVIKTFGLTLFAFCANQVSAMGDPHEISINYLVNSQIEKIEVFGSPRTYESYQNIGPKALFEDSEHRVVFAPSTLDWRRRSLIWALSGASPITDGGSKNPREFDYRWGVILYSKGSSRLHELYLDGRINAGVVDNQTYHFNPKLRLWFYLVIYGSSTWAGITLATWTVIVLSTVCLAVVFLLVRRIRRRNSAS